MCKVCVIRSTLAVPATPPFSDDGIEEAEPPLASPLLGDTDLCRLGDEDDDDDDDELSKSDENDTCLSLFLC